MTDDTTNDTGLNPADDDVNDADVDDVFGAGSDDTDSSVASADNDSTSVTKDDAAPATTDNAANETSADTSTTNSLQDYLQRQMGRANAANYQYIFAKHQLIYLDKAYAEFDNKQHEPFINTLWVKALQGKDNTLPGMPITNRPFSNGFPLRYSEFDHFQRMSINDFNHVLTLNHLGTLTPDLVKQLATDDARSQIPLYDFNNEDDRTHRLIAVYADIIPDRSIVGDAQHKLNNYGAGWVSMHNMAAANKDFNAQLELNQQKQALAAQQANNGKGKDMQQGKGQPTAPCKSSPELD